MERFRSNRETIAAIERGDAPADANLDRSPEHDLSEPAEPVLRRTDLDDATDLDNATDLDDGSDLDHDQPGSRDDEPRSDRADHDRDNDRDRVDLGVGEPDEQSVFEHWYDLEAPDQDAAIGMTTTELVAVPARPVVGDGGGGVQIGKGYGLLIGLLALVVAIGGVVVVSRSTSSSTAEDTAGQAGSGSGQQLASTAVGIQQEAQMLRTRLDELGLQGISIDVDESRGVVVLAGSVASEGERQQVVEAAQAVVSASDLDTTSVTLAGPTGAGDSAVATAAAALPVRRVAVIVPDERTDFSFSQSMADSIDAVVAARGNVELTLVEGARGAAAVDAIRQYAADGYDLVIAHSSGFRPTVDTVAAQYPNVTFAVGTITDEPTLPNVYTYNVAVEDGGAILGAAAARATTSGVVGVVGPVPVGTSKRYLDAFQAAAEAEAPGTTVLVTYTGALNDPAAAAEATRALIESGADVIAGQGHNLGEAVAVAEAAGVLWIGNGVDQAPLGPSTVLASQVYHWDVVIDQIVADIDADRIDGRNLTADYANGGLTIELNPGAGPSETVRPLIDERVAGASN